MFKTNGEKALLAVCLITIFFVGLALITGVGKEVKASESPVKPAVFWYFERMGDEQYRINASELKPLLESGKDIFVLDIRNAEDYEKDRIPGAVNIPFQAVGNNLDKIPKDRPVIVYCYTGQNGGQVVALLNISGYYSKSLSSGWGGWVKEIGNPAIATESQVSPATVETTEEAVTCPTEQ